MLDLHQTFCKIRFDLALKLDGHNSRTAFGFTCQSEIADVDVSLADIGRDRRNGARHILVQNEQGRILTRNGDLHAVDAFNEDLAAADRCTHDFYLLAGCTG